MHLRRTTALTAASLLLAVPMLSSCGFNYATDRPYTPAAGTNNRDGSVDVLGAVIVSAKDDSGTFIASLSNNDQQKSADFESITGAGSDSTLKFQEFPPRTIDPGGAINLSQDGGVPVTGTFTAGDVLPVSISLSNGERVNMDVPVVADDGYFDGFDTSGSTGAQPSGSSSPTASPSSQASSSPSGSSSGSASPSSSPSE